MTESEHTATVDSIEADLSRLRTEFFKQRSKIAELEARDHARADELRALREMVKEMQPL